MLARVVAYKRRSFEHWSNDKSYFRLRLNLFECFLFLQPAAVRKNILFFSDFSSVVENSLKGQHGML